VVHKYQTNVPNFDTLSKDSFTPDVLRCRAPPHGTARHRTATQPQRNRNSARAIQ